MKGREEVSGGRGTQRATGVGLPGRTDAPPTLTGRGQPVWAGPQIWWWEDEVKKLEQRRTETNLPIISYKLTESASIYYKFNNYWHNS